MGQGASVIREGKVTSVSLIEHNGYKEEIKQIFLKGPLHKVQKSCSMSRCTT